jgi:glucose uptake protein GlcU
MGSTALGTAAAALAVVLFSLFPLPTKTFKTGEGLFFQLFMCAGIWTVGVILFFIQCALSSSCPVFVPLAALGGAMWCLANLLLVPIVNTVGIGVCMVTWGCIELLSGWCTARFGLFGLHAQAVRDPSLNAAAVALGVVSLLVLSSATPAVAVGLDKRSEEGGSGEERALLLAPQALPRPPLPSALPLPLFANWEDTGYDFTLFLTAPQKRAFGVAACAVAGALSGSTFSPVQYVVDNRAAFPGASGALLDHLHAHFTGILLTSIFSFVLYCAATRNRPWVSAPLALPAYASGVCWGLAMVCWFLANQNLSIVVAFPLVTLGPGLMSMLIGGYFFKEVSGTRNIALLVVACALFIASACLISLSGGAS